LLAGLTILLLGVVALVVVVRSLHVAGTGAGAGAGSAGPVTPRTASASVRPGGGASARGEASATPATPPVTVAAAGDLACDPAGTGDEDGGNAGPGKCQMKAVGALIASAHPDAFLALGDNQYNDGRLQAFQGGYARAFGALLPITHPAIGNHEYLTKDAAGYFDYFGDRAGPRGEGWYSFDLGAWHVVALNANCDQLDCSSGGPQGRWLKNDLAVHQTACTLAYWHQPRWSSGEHGDNPAVGDLVSLLVEGGADVVLNGHDHDYERFRRQAPDGSADPQHGVREFVVGTGGRSLRGTQGHDGSEVAMSDTFGALFLTLTPASYSWQFRGVDGTVKDKGSTPCH
jgi:hypothetical protein